MKKALIVIVIVVVTLFSFWFFSQEPAHTTHESDPVTEPDLPARDPPPAMTEPGSAPAEEPVEALPEDDGTQLQTPATDPDSVLEQARADDDEAAERAEAAIADILATQEEAAAEAEAAAQAAIDELLAAGDEAAAEAEATVGQAQQSIQQQMAATEPQADALSQTATPDADLRAAEAQGVFTVEGFNFDRAMAAIENSDLDPINMSAARALLENVRDDPEALEAALIQLRGMLGLT